MALLIHENKSIEKVKNNFKKRFCLQFSHWSETRHSDKKQESFITEHIRLNHFQISHSF